MNSAPVTVRIFGSLRPVCADLGLPNVFEIEVAQSGASARDIAIGLKIPTEMIEGVFVNHTVHGINAIVSPGDRIAFVPYDTPGPHRVFLGIYNAGKNDDA